MTPELKLDDQTGFAAPSGSAWRYHRLKGVSKWVRGNSWVTKFDEREWCACGYNGEPLLAWMVADPKIARKHIDEFLPPNVKADTREQSR